MHGTRKTNGLMIAAVLLGTSWVGFAQVQDNSKVEPSPTKKPVPGAKPVAGATKPAAMAKPSIEVDNTDEKMIRQSAAAFVHAYNAQDAKAMSKLFALKAEFTDEVGNLIKGRDAIEQDFTGMFTEFPECKIAVEIDSIRILTPNDHLQELAWMVGDWIDESPDSTVKSSCRWDNSGNYLLHEFELHIAGRGTSNRR